MCTLWKETNIMCTKTFKYSLLISQEATKKCLQSTVLFVICYSSYFKQNNTNIMDFNLGYFCEQRFSSFLSEN